MAELAVIGDRAVEVRRATDTDNAQIAAIWNDEVERGDATTETQLRTAGTQREWLARHGDAHPVIVAVAGGKDTVSGGDESPRTWLRPPVIRPGRAAPGTEILAWGSLSPYRPRPAFAASVEDSVYVKAMHRGRGLGATILAELVGLARERGYHTVVARIRSTNAGSLALHRRMGFDVVGVEREIARVRGRWVDVVIMQLVFPDP